MTKLQRIGVGVVLAAIVVDQATKQIALEYFSPFDPVQVLPFLDFTLAWNRGVSFGLFGNSGVPPWALMLVALAISGFLAWQLWISETRASLWGFALIVGGALGNVIDRAIHGAVVDFVLLSWKSWSWPVFNVADMAITFGVVLILIDSLWPARRSTTS